MSETPYTEVVFENQDTTNVEKEDLKKYTKIDNLDEDPIIHNLRWVCISFLSPEGVYNCNVRAVKVRGCFATKEEADKCAHELQKIDKYFHIFVGEVGKWLLFDPNPDTVEEQHYANETQQQIMQNARKEQMNQLNILAGKKKEQFKKESHNHQNRIKETKKIAKETKNNPVQEKEDKPEKVQKKSHLPNATRERLRKKIEAKNREKALAQVDEEEKKSKFELAKKEENRIEKEENDLYKKLDKVSELDENVNKLNLLLEKAKLAKQAKNE
uniref:Uncharacterized protein n=1 Tax=viral metagenome TaxID=1070528 RepID=A0A6C0EBG5_9ZZZZ